MVISMIDLFASRLSIQKAKCFTWKADPHSLSTAAIQQEWSQETLYAFPLFLLMQKVLSKLTKDEVNAVIWITPA